MTSERIQRSEKGGEAGSDPRGLLLSVPPSLISVRLDACVGRLYGVRTVWTLLEVFNLCIFISFY